MSFALYKSVGSFIFAGFMEIGGGYMVWKAIKGDQPLWIGIIGGILLAMYGMVATFQEAGFGRTYAAYGGVFVIMSLLWGWAIEKTRPDVYDITGATAVLIGTAIIFYAPRK